MTTAVLNQTQTVTDRNSWATPKPVFEKIENMLDIKYDIDLTATSENTKCDAYITKEQDVFKAVLSIRDQNCWLNPPYSIKADQHYKISDFFRLCLTLQTERDCDVTCLLPVNHTGTKAFQTLIGGTPLQRQERNIEIYFYPGRIKFILAGVRMTTPPFSSMLIRFMRSYKKIITVGTLP